MLRILHTLITRRFLMSQDMTPLCETCHQTLILKHLLIDYKKYEAQRQLFLNHTSITQILAPISQQIMNLQKFIYNKDLYKNVKKDSKIFPFLFLVKYIYCTNVLCQSNSIYKLINHNISYS